MRPAERDPLVIDNGAFTLPLEPGWIVMEWLMPNRPFGGSIFQMSNGEASLPRYYVIIPDHYETTLDHLYRDSAGGDIRLPFDLAGSLILLGIHPYDSQFGTAAHTVTDEDRVHFFEEQTRLLYADYDTDGRTQATSLGLTTLSADLTAVFNRENNGVLRVYDTNYHLYTLMIAAPAAAWDETAPQIVDWLNRVTINPVTSITALDDGIPVGLQVGQRAPNFEMTLHDGSIVTLADFRGKPVVLDFWASWCDPCVDEMPTYRSLAADHDSFTILAVNSRETADVVSAFVDDHELNFPVALDESGAISDLYRIHAYPTHIVIDSEGVIRAIPAFETLSERQVLSWGRRFTGVKYV
jgi:peroxiredoxin